MSKSRTATPPWTTLSASRDLADVHFATTKIIGPVQDNLNIHCKASLYEAFPAAEARRLVERFEWRYSPKHGSWLNLAELELAVLSSQCLDRRIPDKQVLTGRGRRLGNTTAQKSRQGQLALHNPRRAHQTQKPKPFNLTELGDQASGRRGHPRVGRTCRGGGWRVRRHRARV